MGKESKEVKALREELEELEDIKKDAVSKQEFELAAELKADIETLKEKLANFTKKKTPPASKVLQSSP